MKVIKESAGPGLDPSLPTSDVVIETRSCQAAVLNALAVLRVRCQADDEVVKLIDLCGRRMARLVELTHESHPDTW